MLHDKNILNANLILASSVNNATVILFVIIRFKPFCVNKLYFLSFHDSICYNVIYWIHKRIDNVVLILG